MTAAVDIAAGALYLGRVMHERLRPCAHRFTYRVFSLYLDIDRVDALAERLRLFSRGRFNLFSFHEKDHGPRDGSALRPWVERHLAAQGVALDGGAIRLLCFPRILGYVFNPLSVYFCHGPAGDLRAALYEVRNTFGQSHCYLLRVPAGHAPGAMIEQTAQKCFHVSPFLALQGAYRFRLREPGDVLSLTIRESDEDGDMLLACHAARRSELSDGALLKAFVTHPLMTLKVIAAIHWEALRLWRKGATFYRLPPMPAETVTAGRDVTELRR
ncbi:MAG TPA: DUF1365 domain-containing protein [Alphaproteobacteria bacterium]|nr:DUF1365 domain-containing protein [Alphaproteobacteria bacterium]